MAISMLALISLKIQNGELIEVSCKEDTMAGQKAVIKLCNFISNELTRKYLPYIKYRRNNRTKYNSK